MATILAYTSPSLGNLYPIAALLAALHARGHRIVLRTHGAGVPVGRGAGFDCARIDPRIEAIAMTDWTARTGLGAIRTGFTVFALRARHEVDDLRRALEETAPDAVVVDTNCWGACAMAEVSGLPWVTFWPYPPYLTSRYAPPFGLGLRPRRDRLGALRDGAVRTVTDELFRRTMIGPVNVIRGELGAPALTSSDDFVLRAPLVLVGTAEPFEYHHPDWDPRVALIGPCELRTTVPEVPIDDAGLPVVMVTTSSERQNDDALPIATLAALADAPVHIVATFPCGVPPTLRIPDNATVRRFVDHGAVLDRAVCAVTHGGMGVTQKALARGVPVCVVPHGRDQFEVARRVELSRSGTQLSARKVNPARLRARIEAARAMSAGARTVADGFAAAGGATRGADLVERLLAVGS
ncbi:nucleotide disphospho-sugar-binding domain-containing protein [Mycobacterium sp. C31M]